MLKVGNFPAGDVPLDGQASALAQIKFVTYKPGGGGGGGGNRVSPWLLPPMIAACW